MQQNRTLRVVKREQRGQTQSSTQAVSAAATPARNPERELRAVVSGWVREHREGAEELRRAAAVLLSGARPRASVPA